MQGLDRDEIANVVTHGIGVLLSVGGFADAGARACRLCTAQHFEAELEPNSWAPVFLLGV